MYLVSRRPIDPEDVTVSVAEDDAPAWDAGTTYALNDAVLRGHRVYVSTVADNLGNDPALEDQTSAGVRWALYRWSNASSAFDGVLTNPSGAVTGDGVLKGDQASYGLDAGQSPLIFDLATQALDTILLFGIDAVEVRVICIDGAGAAVLDRVTPVSGRSVSSWWEWLTRPFLAGANKIAVLDVPASTIRVIVALTGASVALGEMVIGNRVHVGTTLHDGTAGRAVTASRYEFNDYGQLQLVTRPTRNEMTYACACPAGYWSRIKPQMDRMAGTLVGAVGAAHRPSTIQFGVLGTVDWAEDLPEEYEFSFTVKGVI
ncbi:hypothetical protein [Mangrovicoccus algicola]|uniref:Uncharacterized protein n=1 Tax=Mangrovicoccus algicola TaxID=2771008 RepID=A0A8J6YX72_9RHOB|nr:hypothetical protein [Mangrovicoccus algicola]MBE3637461.1 hypothetical protein [Mangrovicoccus algicola]